MKKSAAVTIRLTPELKTLLVKRAQEQHRSITQYLEWLVMQDAAAEGDKTQKKGWINNSA